MSATELKTIENQAPNSVYTPRTDIYETDEAVVVVADLPGVNEDSLDITVENDKLRIHGTAENAPKETHSLAYREYRIRDFERRFILSNRVDGENIKAAYSNGILELTIPKAESAAVKKILVKTG